MRRFWVAGMLVLAVCIWAREVEAEPRADTRWTFRVTWSTGQVSESTDPMGHGRVVMYTGARWQCDRMQVSLNKRGNLMAGFSCDHRDGGFVTVVAGCSPSEDSVDVANAALGDANGYVSFYVSCRTVAARQAVFDKSL